MLRPYFVPTAMVALLASCAAEDPSESFGEREFDASVCKGLADPELTIAKIRLSPGENSYAVDLEWEAPSAQAKDKLRLEVAEHASGPFRAAMDPVTAKKGHGTGRVDKVLEDLFVRLKVVRPNTGKCAATAPVRLAKPDYRDPDDWSKGWIKVVSHVHTIPDEKKEAPGKIHANRINWFNGCFDVLEDDAACHALLKRSFSQGGLEWAVDAARDKGIDSIIVTDHDNAGIWFTDAFRKYDKGDPHGPSVVRGMEWTSGRGHMTVVGNFLPEIPKGKDVFDLATGRAVQRATPLPLDTCDDTDQNNDIHYPDYNGPDTPCRRADHHGYGDDPVSVADARESIQELKKAGALVFANHPTNDDPTSTPMKWNLENFDLLDGVELATPDPTVSNRDTPEYWRLKGLQQGHRWVGIAGTDCHVPEGSYTGDTACNKMLHGVLTTTHLDAPYMWMKPLGSTAHLAPNAPPLVVAAMREGRLSVVQDKDPAVIVDLGVDTNGDGYLDYVSGSTIPACEHPKRDVFRVQVRVKPVQTHDYNVSVWRNGKETKILQDQKLEAGKVWVGTTELRRHADLPEGTTYGYVMVQVRENKTAWPDNDADFSTPIWFTRPMPDVHACNTRNADGR